jgi:hypothetical protein
MNLKLKYRIIGVIVILIFLLSIIFFLNSLYGSNRNDTSVEDIASDYPETSFSYPSIDDIAKNSFDNSSSILPNSDEQSFEEAMNEIKEENGGEISPEDVKTIKPGEENDLPDGSYYISPDDPTVGQDNPGPGDEGYDQPSGVWKMYLNSVDITSGYPNMNKGLRNPLKKLNRKKYNNDLIDDPRFKEFMVGILGIEKSKKHMTVYVENLKDVPAIKKKLYKKFTNADYKSLPKNYLQLKLAENKATVKNLVDVFQFVDYSKNSEKVFGEHRYIMYDIAPREGKVFVKCKEYEPLVKLKKIDSYVAKYVLTEQEWFEWENDFPDLFANYNYNYNFRPHDTPKFYGGAGILTRDTKSRNFMSCTSGPIVKDISGKKVYGTTAGHCGENKYKAYTYKKSLSVAKYYGKIPSKKKYPEYDIVKLQGGKSYSPFIWTTRGSFVNLKYSKDVNFNKTNGDSATPVRKITGTIGGEIGKKYCISGLTSGVRCNAELAYKNTSAKLCEKRDVNNKCVKYNLSQHLFLFTSMSGISDHGDSGGPVYLPTSKKEAQILGTIVGGGCGDNTMISKNQKGVNVRYKCVLYATARDTFKNYLKADVVVAKKKDKSKI